jgi:hypothetical protein
MFGTSNTIIHKARADKYVYEELDFKKDGKLNSLSDILNNLDKK